MITPEQINSFVIQTYRQCRVLLRRNSKCLRRLQKEFFNNKTHDTNILKSDVVLKIISLINIKIKCFYKLNL